MVNPAHCPDLGTCNTLVMFFVSSILLEIPLLVPPFHTSSNDQTTHYTAIFAISTALLPSTSCYHYSLRLVVFLSTELRPSFLRSRSHDVSLWITALSRASLLLSEGVLRRSWRPLRLDSSCLRLFAMWRFALPRAFRCSQRVFTSAKSGAFSV